MGAAVLRFGFYIRNCLLNWFFPADASIYDVSPTNHSYMGSENITKPETPSQPAFRSYHTFILTGWVAMLLLLALIGYCHGDKLCQKLLRTFKCGYSQTQSLTNAMEGNESVQEVNDLPTYEEAFYMEKPRITVSTCSVDGDACHSLENDQYANGLVILNSTKVNDRHHTHSNENDLPTYREALQIVAQDIVPS